MRQEHFEIRVFGEDGNLQVVVFYRGQGIDYGFASTQEQVETLVAKFRAKIESVVD